MRKALVFRDPCLEVIAVPMKEASDGTWYHGSP